MSQPPLVSSSRPRVRARWQEFETWVGSRSSAVVLFALSLVVFALQSAVMPAYPGRDMGRYVQTYVQLGYDEIVLPSVMNTRGPLAALGVGLPLELGGIPAEVWLAVLYASSILAWGFVALTFGPRAALLATGLLLAYPGYGILFHGLASDSLFAAGFAGWAVLLTRATLRPSTARFALAGLGMGALVLIRPANQVLVAMALLPLVLPGAWGERLRRVAAFFVASVAVTQGWKALAKALYGDGVSLEPSTPVVALAGLLLVGLFVRPFWRGRAALVAVLAGAAVALVAGVVAKGPTGAVATVAQVPGGNPFVFRVFVIDSLIAPDNGPASSELARAVQSQLLGKEPYRSYGIDVNEFFSSRSDRMFDDLDSLSGVDLPTAADEAIRAHPGAFVEGIARTFWGLLWQKRVYGPETGAAEDGGGESGSKSEGGSPDVVVIDGRKLPRPSEGQPIPAARVGPSLRTLYGNAREVWFSATEHRLVFDDPRDEARVQQLDADESRLSGRLPARSGSAGLAHRLNQASKGFPPPAFWLALGILAVAVRRPRNSLVAIVPVVAALVLIVSTGLVAEPVAEYAAPVNPAFILLAAAGLLGAGARGRLRGLSGESRSR